MRIVRALDSLKKRYAMKHYAVVGAGGYGREVMPLVQQALNEDVQAGDIRLFFVVEGEPEAMDVNGYEIISLDDFCTISGDRFFNIAIGDSATRERISATLLERGCKPFPVKASNAVVFASSNISEGAILSPFVTITANARIGKYFHANIYSYVAHDCVIGDFVTFAPGVKCNGNVVVEDHAYIGTGAIIKQGSSGKPLVIGRGAVVGMGAVVTKNVDAYTTVVGNPARLLEAK